MYIVGSLWMLLTLKVHDGIKIEHGTISHSFVLVSHKHEEYLLQIKLIRDMYIQLKVYGYIIFWGISCHYIQVCSSWFTVR